MLISCRPERAPTSYTLMIKPQAGPDKTIQTPMNTPISFTYTASAGDSQVAPKPQIVGAPQYGKVLSCQHESRNIRCIYEPNLNFVGSDKIQFVTVDGDLKSDDLGTLNIIVTYNGDGEVTIPGDDLPGDFQDDSDQANLTCAQASAQGLLVSVTKTVSFPAAIECEFNEAGTEVNQLNAAGNGPRQNARIRARREQFSQFHLDTPGTICDMDFNFPTQTMQYDDEIFLTLNEYVLMSSTNYSDQSEDSRYENGLKTNSIGFQTYKWIGDNSLYNLYYSHQVTPKYCMGLNTESTNYHQKCDIPPTEQEGQMKLDIPNHYIVNLGLASQLNYPLEPSPLFKFGFITIGDNDNGDCEHSAYSFTVTIKYAPSTN